MSKYVKRAGKGAADLTSGAIKKAFSAVLADLAKEVIEETGMGEAARTKIMEVGFKVVKDLGIDPKNVQRELIKSAIKKEMNLK